MEIFDEIVSTKTEDGKVEVKLVSPSAEEVENAVDDFSKSAREFRILHSCPDGATDSGRSGILWWRALEQLACADSRLRDVFCGPDHSPCSIAQYHRYRLKLIDGKQYRTDA